METLETLRRQLASFADLASVVHTMKALAVVNLREYERAVHSLAGYYSTVERGLAATLRTLPEWPTRPRPRSNRVAAVVFGSDHGLCGRFNEDLAEYARERLSEAVGVPGEPPLLIAVGARTRALLEETGLAFASELRVPGSAAAITGTVRQLLLAIDRWRHEQGIERVYLLHNRPVPGGRYHPTGIELLPVDLAHFRRLAQAPWPSRSLPLHTMPTEHLLQSLFKQYFFVSLFRAAAESLAAENSSRWAAMQLADENLGERRRELTAEFLRLRQDTITAELLDVVAGYEAIRTGRSASSSESGGSALERPARKHPDELAPR